MTQLFKRRANSIAKASVIGVPLLVLGTAAALFGFARSDFLTHVESPIEQPVPFSHQHHVGGLGIDCRYCHTTVEQSQFAGIPPTETCMTCHSQILKDAPVLQPVRDSWQTGRPIKWTRVHDLPDYVYFNHSIHVAKGVGCATCHGQVNEMPLTWKTQELQMRWCLSCHREPEKFLRPTSEVVNMKYEAPPDQLAFGQQLVRENNVHTAGLTDCYTCHR
ncbi:MAG: cytochrome c family protein [Verrucomicrobiota bacterium]|nr:cytochrome c family protein [Verrucomicrobiota bacterium]MDQ6940386.1 cytochrome c family protein [Verrucomicrobiota bacterium]